MNNKDVCHLHVHNEYSLLDGFGSAEAYCERAEEMGFRHLALTNHGNVDGCIKFQRAADKVGIHSILGTEAYIVKDMSVKAKGDNRFHITLLAKNIVGWKNLLQLVTYSNIQGFYRRPRIDPDLLLDYTDGLVIMTACCSGFIRMPGGRELLYKLAEKTDVFLEIMPVQMEVQREMNKWVMEIHKEVNLPIVATMDCHYPLKGQNELQEVLLAIQSKKKWNDPKRWKFDIDDLYLKSADEMIESFDKLGGIPRSKVLEAMENTMVVADMCKLHVDPIPVILPKVDVLQYRGLDEKEQLTRLILDGLDRKAAKHEWIGQDIDKYYERVEEELGLIFELGFERYFLIVWELIGWCKKNDIMTGPGRGCFASDSCVLTKDGMKFIRDILPGKDYVLGANGRFNAVLEKFEYDINEDISLLIVGDTKVLCTSDHKFLTTNGYVRADELRIGEGIISYEHQTSGKSKNRNETYDCKRDSKVFGIQDSCGESSIDYCGGQAIPQTFKSISWLCVQNLWPGFIGWCEKNLQQEVWSCLATNMQQMHMQGCLQYKGAQVGRQQSAKHCPKQARGKTETENCSVGSAQKRPNIDIKKGKGAGICKCSRGHKAQSGKAQKENSSGQRVCDEVYAQRVCEWMGKQDFVPIIIGALLYFGDNEGWSPDTEVSTQNEDKLKTLYSRLLDRWRQNCRSQRLYARPRKSCLGTQGCPDVFWKEGVKVYLCERSGIEEGWLYTDRFGVLQESGCCFHKEQSSIKLVEACKAVGYRGKVYDLKVDDDPSYNIEGLIVHNSVGGCLCAFLLEITSVDSLYWDLPFSRFISPARIDLPDIDMDFEDIKRGKIRKHLEDLYGKFNVTSLSTFARLSGRSAIRDISRVFEIPYKDVDAAAKSIVVRSLGDFRAAYTIEDAFSAFEDGIKFKRKYPRVSRIAIAMEGQIKGAGKHAAAMCVAGSDLRSGCNISLSMRQSEPICSFDKYDAEHLGLMKLDVLGLNALTVLHAAKKLIKKRYDTDIDYEEILFDDKKVLAEFTKGNTAGVFQFASHSMIKLCKEIHTEDFEQVISLNALNRPGCLRSGMATDYKERKHGEKKIPEMHPIMAKITKNTFGIVLFQEQIMYIMYDLAGLPWKTADMVRKVISKSTGEEQFMKFKQLFIDGCKKKDTLNPKEAKSIFEELKHFGSYGFNRAHSVEYAMIAWWDMWLKVKYPVEFIVSLLSFGPEGEKKLEHVAEAKRLGLKLFLPDINKSKSKVWKADEKGNLLIPLCEVKGIGPAAGDAIIKHRGDEPFKDKDDFVSRVPKRQVNSRVVALLEKVGVFNSSATLELSEEKLDELSDLFDFDLSNDPMYRYKKMLKVIKLGIKLSKLADVTTKKDPAKKLYFGRMLNVKFGYKEKVKNSKTGADASKGLGGVYGNFNDGTDFAMLTFNSDLYESRKNEIEHCAGQWLMARGSSPFKTDSVFADGAWFGDDLLKGEAKGLGLELAKEVLYTDSFAHMFADLLRCNACNLRGECRRPVLPSYGQLNIMIVGEGPGPAEDRQGEGFVGDSGDLLFGKPKVRSVVTLEQRGIPRSLCHITNVIKCYPKITKTPKAVHIRECSKWLEEEIKIVKPFIILSFGNTGLKFFKEMDSGIMNLNGTTEWNDKFNCFVCYSIHPASVLYESSNASLLNDAFTNFVDKIGVLGFGL